MKITAKLLCVKCPNHLFLYCHFSLDGTSSSQAAPPTRRSFSRSSSKGNAGGVSRDTSRPPSAFDTDYFREPVVKSPPEPTRVKSPTEVMVRSPDPINWTVPLDTGKTFSVTQSVRDGGTYFFMIFESTNNKDLISQLFLLAYLALLHIKYLIFL